MTDQEMTDMARRFALAAHSEAMLALLHVFVNEATIRNQLPETTRTARRLLADMGNLEPEFRSIAALRAPA